MDLVIFGVLALVSVIGMMILINIVRFGTIEDGVEATMGALPALTLGATTAGIIMALELVAMIFGTLIMAPDLLAMVAISALGYLTLEGILTVQPETYGWLVIIGFSAAVLLRRG